MVTHVEEFVDVQTIPHITDLISSQTLWRKPPSTADQTRHAFEFEQPHDWLRVGGNSQREQKPREKQKSRHNNGIFKTRCTSSELPPVWRTLLSASHWLKYTKTRCFNRIVLVLSRCSGDCPPWWLAHVGSRRWGTHTSSALAATTAMLVVKLRQSPKCQRGVKHKNSRVPNVLLQFEPAYIWILSKNITLTMWWGHMIRHENQQDQRSAWRLSQVPFFKSIIYTRCQARVIL